MGSPTKEVPMAVQTSSPAATQQGVLVSTEWVAQHLNDRTARIVEVDVDTKAYGEDHVPNAAGWAWDTQLCDTIRRDIIPKDKCEKLLGDSGISNNTTVILYGDNNNWFAAWAFCQLKSYGHKTVRLLTGGRKKWIAEGRDLVMDPPKVAPAAYKAQEADNSLRAFLPEVMKASTERAAQMVDVRSPQEYSGEILAPPGLPETCQRGGPIPRS